MEYKPQKRLLGINNTKMLKSIELGYLTAILHLAPHKLSGVNICPKASSWLLYGVFKYKRSRSI
jgi:hypothetical protein